MQQLAYAKLTLALRIVGVRDDGYHLLDSEMVAIDLCDILTFGPGDGLRVVDMTANRTGSALADTDDNLVRRALAAVGREAQIRLEKHIPVGAGLGGGSADAAAVLRWAGCESLALAAALGSDVPFCLAGGRARVQGVGEAVEPLPAEDRIFTLFTPPVGVATAAVYRQWDRMGGPHGANGNDLEPAALAVEPELGRWRDELARRSGLVPRLAGSGGTWFVEGAFADIPGTVVTRTVPPAGKAERG